MAVDLGDVREASQGARAVTVRSAVYREARGVIVARTLTLELDERAWQRLDRLAAAIPGESTNGLIAVILDHVQQGVYRSASWERGWLASVVGDKAIEEAYESNEDPLYRKEQ